MLINACRELISRLKRCGIPMSKNSWRFRPVELRRLVKAVTSIGMTPSGIEVGSDGTIKVLVVVEPESPSLESEGAPA
jgi:hypothetical protein